MVFQHRYADIRRKLRNELLLDAIGILSTMLESPNIKSIDFTSGSDHSIYAAVTFHDDSKKRIKVWWTLQNTKFDMEMLTWYAIGLLFLSNPSAVQTDFADYTVLD